LESYKPKSLEEGFTKIGEIKADGDSWTKRREIVLKNVHTNVTTLIAEAKNDEKYTVALNNLGYAYEKEKMINEAIGSYIQALKTDPENETAISRVQILKRRIPKSG
jgi:tetratricopeptide (TPR) repeat protein